MECYKKCLSCTKMKTNSQYVVNNNRDLKKGIKGCCLGCNKVFKRTNYSTKRMIVDVIDLFHHKRIKMT